MAKENKGHDGFNADFQNAVNMPSYTTLAKNENLIGLATDSDYVDDNDNTLHVTFNKDGKMTSSKKGITIPNDVYADHASIPSSTDDQSRNMVIQNRVSDAIIDHADESGYHAPEAVAVKIADNFLSIAEKNPSMMKQLYDGQNKFFDFNHGEGAETATTG